MMEMSEEPDRSWLKPEQIEKMRTAAVKNSASYLASRNDLIIGLMADTALRVGELVQLRVEMFDASDGVLRISPQMQKQYPNDEGTPDPATIDLQDDTVRSLQMYLNSRWKDSEYVFPSRQSPKMTTESIRNVVQKAAKHADIEPFVGHAGRGGPSDVTPHTLRHSLAYRLLEREEDNTLYDVSRRLRHSSIQTTERIYSHFDRI